jgi:hypothetical protein
MQPLKCHIFTQTSGCCFSKIEFRIYLGHLGRYPVHAAIRHLTEKEMTHGFSYFNKSFWLKVTIVDVRSNYEALLAININSLVKSLTIAGIYPRVIKSCLDHVDFSPIKLDLRNEHYFNWVSCHVFNSYSPLLA